MKKLSSLFIAFAIVFLIGMTGVSAEETSDEYVIQLNDNYYKTFNEALTALKTVATTTNTMTVLKDIEDDNTGFYQFSKNVTIDLNGHNITTGRYFLIFNKHITITGKGIMYLSNYSPFSLLGSNKETATNTSSLTINKDVTLHSTYEGWAYMIGLTFTNYTAYKYGITVNFNGKMESDQNTNLVGFFQNGMFVGNTAVININKDAILNTHTGLVNSSDSTVNFKGTINSTNSGIEMRAGKLNIDGGKINVSYNGLKVAPNGSGSTTFGAAIAISQHTTKLPIEVNISGGQFNAHTPFNEANPQNNDADSISKIKLSITGGTFNSASEESVKSETKTKFITGGTYNKQIDQKYISDNKTLYKINDAKYKVDDKSSIQANTKIAVEKGKEVSDTITLTGPDYTTTNIKDNIITVNNHKIKGLEIGETTITVNNNDVYNNEQKTIDVLVYNLDAEDKATENNEASISNAVKNILENKNVKGIDNETANKIKDAVENGKTITTELETEKITKSSLTSNERKLINKELKDNENIISYYDINFLLKVDGDEIGKATELENKVKVSLPIPTDIEEVKNGYERHYYVIRIHNGKTTKIEASIENNKLTFETDEFSTYALTYIDTKSSIFALNPNTVDNIEIFALLAMFTTAAILITKRKYLLPKA